MYWKFSVIEGSFNSGSNQEFENKRGIFRIYASLIYQRRRYFPIACSHSSPVNSEHS